MSKKLALVDVRGRKDEWGVAFHASEEQIAAMRADGIEVFIVENLVPAGVAEAGLTRPWCFLQDIWNFRNPWGNSR